MLIRARNRSTLPSMHHLCPHPHFQTNRLAGLAISIPKLLFIPNVAFLLRGTTPTPPKAAKVDGLGGSFAGLIANPCKFAGVKY